MESGEWKSVGSLLTREPMVRWGVGSVGQEGSAGLGGKTIATDVADWADYRRLLSILRTQAPELRRPRATLSGPRVDGWFAAIMSCIGFSHNIYEKNK